MRSPDWCGSVDWASSCKLGGHWFHFQSGHTPGLPARSRIGGVREAVDQCFAPCLSPSLPLSLKIRKGRERGNEEGRKGGKGKEKRRTGRGEREGKKREEKTFFVPYPVSPDHNILQN